MKPGYMCVVSSVPPVRGKGAVRVISVPLQGAEMEESWLEKSLEKERLLLVGKEEEWQESSL